MGRKQSFCQKVYDMTTTPRIPLDKKFEARTPGMLQNRAARLQEEIPAMSGADVIGEVARIGRHAGQLVLEIQVAGIPLVRSYDAAVPVLGKSSAMAREISARKGLGGEIKPNQVTFQKLN